MFDLTNPYIVPSHQGGHSCVRSDHRPNGPWAIRCDQGLCMGKARPGIDWASPCPYKSLSQPPPPEALGFLRRIPAIVVFLGLFFLSKEVCPDGSSGYVFPFYFPTFATGFPFIRDHIKSSGKFTISTRLKIGSQTPSPGPSIFSGNFSVDVDLGYK